MSNLSRIAKNARSVYRWPYEKRPYCLYNFWLDPFTKKKFNENSLVIQVEGNIASGKQDFGRRLADQMGMHYVPQIDIERFFYTGHGYDFRALNPLLPERLRSCDLEMFHENPARHSTIHMCYVIFRLRLLQYIKALQHLFNTGQGVVLSRSVFTDRVFVEAMHDMGWLPRGYLRGDGVRFYDWKVHYNHIRNQVLADMLMPHLTIHLDTPVETCMERIKKSNDPVVANSKALVPEFLEAIEKAYEDVALPKAEIYGHVLKYDNSERMSDDEITDIVHDIKELDFTYDYHDTRFESWDDQQRIFWYARMRATYTSSIALKFFNRQSSHWYDIAGLGDSITNPDLILRDLLLEKHVQDFGHRAHYDVDSRFKSWIQVFLNYSNFEQRFWKDLRGTGLL